MIACATLVFLACRMAKRFQWVAPDELINLGMNDRAVVKRGFGRDMLKAQHRVL